MVFRYRYRVATAVFGQLLNWRIPYF